MKSLRILIVLVGIGLMAGALSHFEPFQGRTDETQADWSVSEQSRLEKALLHAEPGSALAFKLQTKLDRLEQWREGLPQSGFPDEFNRVLYEMKVPSDRTVPDYEPGYRFREFDKAPRMQMTDKSLIWHSRGPGNVAGRARGIVVDPDDPTGLTWFIAAVGGGVWHTADGGTTWNELTDDVPNLAIQSIAMAPSNTSVLYVGTGESFYNIDTMNGNGMLKSVDKGATWAPIASTLNDPRFNNVSRIIVSPTDPDLVLVSTTTGRFKLSLYPSTSIFRSTNGGVSWTEVYNQTGAGDFSDPARVLQLVADPNDFSVQYAATDAGGILKSVDTGQTWAFINTGITDFSGRFEMAISPVNSNYLYVSAEGASNSILWVSWNAGATWNETFENGGEPSWLGGQGWYDNTIACHPTDPTIVYVGGPQLYRIELDSVGSNQHTTTPMASYGFPHPDHHGIAIVHDGGGWWILGTNDGGVTRTASGESGFTMPILGMTTTQFYGVDKRPGSSAYFGGMQDNGTWFSPDDPTGTTPWTFAIGGDGYETSWHFDDPQKMIGGYQYNGLTRSLDGGATWNSATSGLADTGGGNAPFITKIGKSAARPDDLFAVGVSGVWRSTNFGGSWNLATINSGTWGGLSSFHDVRVSAADPDVVWAGARMDVDGDILVSTNGGATFNGTTDYTTVTMGGISGLAADPHDAATAYVLFSYAERPKILKTVDYGANWADISGFGTGSVSTNGFPDVAVYDLMVFPNDASHIWVGSEIGLIESVDGGANWALADNGLPAVGIWKLAAIEDEIVLATHGRGIWTTTDPTLLNGSTYNPLLVRAVQVPAGDLHLELNLRSVYDSTQVRIDGNVVTTYGPNTVLQIETLDLPVLTAGSRTILARSFKDGGVYESVTKVVDVTVFGTPVYDYTNVLDTVAEGDDFGTHAMTWTTPGGFANGALHTGHNYQNAESPTALLLKPIIISNPTTLDFDEIVIVEPGEPGSTFGDYSFWDYVIVEGTSDGVTWVPLVDGYDSRADAAWLSAYNSGQSGSPSLYRSRNIVLNDTFAQGATVLLRFRLYADGSVNAWGWAVDNVVVTSNGVTGVDGLPTAPVLAQNYPNPFNPQTDISFDLPRSGRVKLQVFDLRGRVLRTLVDEHRSAGTHVATWNGRDDRGAETAAGVYFYRLTTGEQSLQKKMTLLK